MGMPGMPAQAASKPIGSMLENGVARAGSFQVGPRVDAQIALEVGHRGVAEDHVPPQHERSG